MNKKQLHCVKLLFSHVLKNVPEILIDDNSIVIGQAITISKATIAKNSLVGEIKVPGYCVEAPAYNPKDAYTPEDVDVVTVGEYSNFEQAAKSALMVWIDALINESQGY